MPAAPSHGLCGSAGGLPSQSPNGDSSPEGGAKSRLPPWGRCHAKGMTERAFPAAPAAHVRQWFDVHERQRAAMGANCPARSRAANCPVRPRTAKSSIAIHRNICYSRSAWDTMRESAKKRYKVGCLRSLQGEQLAIGAIAFSPRRKTAVLWRLAFYRRA